MGYKKWGKEISFIDLPVSESLEHNCSVRMIVSVEKVVRWREVCITPRAVNNVKGTHLLEDSRP